MRWTDLLGTALAVGAIAASGCKRTASGPGLEVDLEVTAPRVRR